MTSLARGAQQNEDDDYFRSHHMAIEVINALINGRDIKFGEGLKDESVRDSMVTFLIAGKVVVWF